MRRQPSITDYVKIIRELRKEREHVVEPLFDFLNADLEKEGRYVAERLMQRIAPNSASDPKSWFAKPELYNEDGSKEVREGTVLKLQSVWKEYLESFLDPMEGEPLIITGAIWGLKSIETVNLVANYREDVLHGSIWGPSPYGLPRSIDVYCLVFSMLLVMSQLISGGLYGRCKECKKLFLKDRKDMIYCRASCSSRSRRRTYRQTHPYPYKKRDFN